KYPGHITLVGDSVDYFLTEPLPLLYRDQTMLVLDFTQAQKLLAGARFERALTSDLGIAQIAEILHLFSSEIAANIILTRDDTSYVAARSSVATTPSVST